MAESQLDKQLFERAASMLRVQGIISIVFGGLGVFVGLLVILGFGIGAVSSYTSSEAAGAIFMLAMSFVFIFLPHAYLVVSGATLLRQPAPTVARTLTIINLVVGVFLNLVVLVFAIISLTQSTDYERYFHHHRK